jgi:hypothetical protein
MRLSQWINYQCSCMGDRRGSVCHALGPTIGEVKSWACLNCLQAYIAIFDLSGKYPRQIHSERFDCIMDLPECLQFSFTWFDDEGRGPFAWDDDEEWSIEDDEKVAKLRHKLGLPELDSSLYERAADAIERTISEWE